MRLFDTSFIIDLSNSDPEALRVANKVDEEGSVAAISVISVHEYLFGIHLRFFQDEKELLDSKLQAAERQLSAFMILPLTKEIVMESARIEAWLTKRGRIIGINDIYISATALVNKATVVTRNTSHFDGIEKLSVEKY